MLNVIKFYLSVIASFIVSFVWNTFLRRNNNIQTNCFVNKRAILKGGVKINRNTIINENVVIGENVVVGSDVILKNVTIGCNSNIEKGVIMTGYGPGKITIGEECYIGFYNILDFSETISIGNYVHIAGPSTGVWTHSSANMCFNGDRLNQKNSFNRPTKRVTIEDCVYIGCNCTIYPGVKIGHHSIVAPNSVVTKDVDPFTLVGGVPAIKKKDLYGN